MRKLLLFLFVFSGFVLNAQIEEIRRITKQLCSPEFHGRGYVNKGDSLAADYLVSEFKKLGVDSYKKINYLQPFSIQGINRFPDVMSVKHGEKELTPGVHFMIDPTSSGGKMELNPVVIDGRRLIKGPDLEFDQNYIRSKIEHFGNDGKNCYLLDIGGIGKDTTKVVMGLSSALCEFGPVIEVMDRKFTYSVGRSQMKHPLIYIQDSIYQEGQSFTIDINAEFVENYNSQNVLAYLPAKKMCAKTVVFTAHYDHLGRMGANTYFPGGNDNASGTAMLLTMAKYFKENPSNYNIMFIAFAGEEAGLVGSRYFVENTPIKLKKIRFLLNLDIMGSGEDGITAVNSTVHEEEFKLLQSINEEKVLLKKVKKRGPTSNSDHYWFTQEGVPAFFIYTMGLNQNYHDVFDTYENLSFNEYEDITKLLVTFVERL